MPATVGPRSAFADSVVAATQRVFEGEQAATSDLLLAGLRIRLKASDTDLLAKFTTSLVVVEPGAVTQPADITVWLWDSRATGQERPPMPQAVAAAVKNRDPGLARGDGGPPIVYEPVSQILTVVHPGRREVVVCVADGARIPWYETAAPLRAALGWILAAHGHTLVHGAAVATEHGAAVLIGDSGAGKSTTALRCLASGMGFLGDDVCVVGPGPQPLVQALYRSAKTGRGEQLPLSSAPATVGQMTPMRLGAPGPGQKDVHRLADGHPNLVTGPRPLVAVLRLDRSGNRPGLRTTGDGAGAAARIIAATTAPLTPTAGPEMLVRVSRLVRALPVATLVLADSTAAVAEQVASAIRWGAAAAAGPGPDGVPVLASAAAARTGEAPGGFGTAMGAMDTAAGGAGITPDGTSTATGGEGAAAGGAGAAPDGEGAAAGTRGTASVEDPGGH